MKHTIAIIGSGLMGCGIALVFSLHGYPVQLFGRSAKSLENAEKTITKELALLVEAGLYQSACARAGRELITFHTVMAEAVSKAMMVIECVPEKMELKQALFSELDALCDPSVILASNTSVMSITEIATRTEHKERVIGTHFWNPAYLLPLVEVVATVHALPEIIEKTMELMRSVGKHPIHVKKDVPGFVATRMQHALWREAFHILNEGIADAKTIDEAVRYSFGMRLPTLGPMENADMIGLDLVFDIQRYVFEYLANNQEPSAVLENAVKLGHLGFKSAGTGFQHWSAEEIAASKERLSRYLIEVALREQSLT